MTMINARIMQDNTDRSTVSVDNIADKEIDAASRVVDKVNNPGECVILESAYRHLSDPSSLLELPETRLRGKNNNLKLYLVLPKNSHQKAI